MTTHPTRPERRLDAPIYDNRTDAAYDRLETSRPHLARDGVLLRLAHAVSRLLGGDDPTERAIRSGDDPR